MPVLLEDRGTGKHSLIAGSGSSRVAGLHIRLVVCYGRGEAYSLVGLLSVDVEAS